MENIVLVVMDTVSAFNLPFYGYERNTTPFLSELAEENRLYTHAYANAPWTLPSHASLFTGKLPSEHGSTTKNVSFDNRSLAEEMSEKGYTTYAATNNLITAITGFERGFDTFLGAEEIQLEYRNLHALKAVLNRERDGEYDSKKEKYADFLKEVVIRRDLRSMAAGIKYLKDKRKGEESSYAFVHDSGAEATNAVVKDLLSEESSSFFLFVNYMEPHETYDPPEDLAKMWVKDVEATKEEYRSLGKLGRPENIETEIGADLREGVRGLYDAEIRYLDGKIQVLYEHITERFPDTTFIITSDHGENLGHNGMWGHQYGIWERLLHVPLIIAGENVQQKTVDAPVSLRELHEVIAGEKDVDDLGSEEIFAEYHGAKHFLGADEDAQREVMENESRCIVKGRRGAVRNSHLDDVFFGPGSEDVSDRDLIETLDYRFDTETEGIDI
ncbi:MAG: sulfatase [Candidatus Nanohaloarchaea archaeon]